MKVRELLIVVVVLALVVFAVQGCGKKGEEEAAAPAAGGPGAGPGGGPMAGPGGGSGGGPMGGPGGAPMGGPGAGPGMATPEAGEEAGMDAGALVEEGMAAKAAGDYDTAIAKLVEASAAEPMNEDACWGLAWLYAEKGRTDEAVEMFNKVLEMTQDPTRQSEAQAALERLQ